MMRKCRLSLLLPLSLTVGGAALLAADKADKPAVDLTRLPPAATSAVDFARDVKPILADNCVSCHGPRKHEGGLQLNARQAALAGGDNGPVLVPGKSLDSRLIHLVAGADPDAFMPPKKKGKPLTPDQVGLLRAWVDQGAKWPDGVEIGPAGVDHWAYKKPVRPALPDVKDKAWVRNPIDAFVLARLEKEGLKPSPEADRAVLLRRLSLDLIGLPPTPEEVEAFAMDSSSDAYERQVARLLASPHYGERWARPWLDLARYGDTHGYERDYLRSMWPWRDWVIDAFNRDMPFDRFTTEQIAGDLLPGATADDKIASAFHRNAMLNSEDGSDDEEWRVAAVVDRVNTTGTVWLGTTIGCAQCHTHKYDPFTQKEYYRLFAFLNNTADGGNANKFTGPEIEVPARNFADDATKAEIAKLRAELGGPNEAADAGQAEWDAKQPKVEWAVPDDVEFAALESKGSKQADGSWLVMGEPSGSDTYTLKVKTPLTGITGLRLEVLPDPTLPGDGPGRAADGTFILSEIKVTAAPLAGGDAKPVALKDARADFSQDKWAVGASIDGKTNTGWGIAPLNGKPHEAVWQATDPVDLPGGALLTVVLDQRRGQKDTIGRFRLALTTADREKLSGKGDLPPPAVSRALAVAADERSDEQKKAVRDYYRGIGPEMKAVRDRLAQLEPNPKAGKVLVMQELPKPRQTFVMVRGNFQNPGDAVTPGVPDVLNPMPKDAPANRIGLAQWLVSKDNPLTARVAVNRFWEGYFGTGIVKTSEDFGTKGEPPSHPELLDWLACEFMEPTAPGGSMTPWSMKHIHRLIVTSATYRQSNKMTPALVEKDPENRLLARGPRVRLEAEMVRDQALAASGLLSPKIGGPSVMPPQPDGVWNRPYTGNKWETSPGGDRYRRALYTFWRRTAPYPSMTTFDTPSREVCTVRRPRTNTPLQALTVLNDPVYVEAAQALARRVMASAAKTDEDRVTYAFRLCVARSPDERERGRLVGLYREELENYRKDAAAAKTFVTKGSPAPAPEGMSVSELAAWTVVGNVLLNLDETVTKG